MFYFFFSISSDSEPRLTIDEEEGSAATAQQQPGDVDDAVLPDIGTGPLTQRRHINVSIHGGHAVPHVRYACNHFCSITQKQNSKEFDM